MTVLGCFHSQFGLAARLIGKRMRPGDVMLQPTPPAPPEIDGYLKKLKRKTISISGNWNKRWFFVDPKRREFGYADTKRSARRSSIYLDDITAVVQFDDTRFQVESRTRTFFLWGESKASTACWVTSLEGYRKKVIEYEKDTIVYAAATAAGATHAFAARPTIIIDNPQQSSSIIRESRLSKSSTASDVSKSKREKGDISSPIKFPSKNEQRVVSPLVKDDSKSQSSTSLDRERRNMDRHHDQERGRDRDFKVEHEPSNDHDRGRNYVQVSTNDRRDRNTQVPYSGRVSMQAWVDDF